MELADGAPPPPPPIKILSKFTKNFVQPQDEYLPADESDPTQPIVQFRLEKAINVIGMFHVKCLSTDKYWQVKPVGTSDIPWITADADEKNEDPFSPACTVFRIEHVTPDPTTTIRFHHLYLKRFACVDITSKPPPYRLCALYENPDKDARDVFVYSNF